MQAEGRKGLPLTLAAAFLAALALDQASKAMVRALLPQGERVVSLSFIKLRQVRNPGTAFGIIQGRSWPLFLASIAVFAVLLLALWRWGRPGGRLFQAGLGLIMGGAVGNIIDRIALGAVVDFIDVGFWPVFNLADTAIVVGVGMVLLSVIMDTSRTRPGREREKGGV
ncbi:MAG: signal peptidase II [Actinomycetota bacterium]|nr:signal peptidase II [Actinomycetota bacterium]